MSEVTTNPQPQVLRIQQAADYVGCSRSFVHQLVRRGEIRRLQLSIRCAGYLRADLDAWLARKIEDATPQPSVALEG